ncbi:hypothetical protein ACFL2Q_15520 [Thermodesulfobacteriota bacterium]
MDTHALLWWLADHPNLSHGARSLIADTSKPAFVSAVVIRVIRVKQALGKLAIAPDFREVLDEQPFEMLPITIEHAHAI